MDIRSLAVNDLPALRVLGCAARDEGFPGLLAFLDEVDAGRMKIASESVVFIAVVERGAIIGVGGLSADSHVDDGSVGRLRHFYLDPEYRGHGLGRLLVAHLEMRAVEAGYATLRLVASSLGAALFFERLGYGVAGQQTATHQRHLPA